MKAEEFEIKTIEKSRYLNKCQFAEAYHKEEVKWLMPLLKKIISSRYHISSDGISCLKITLVEEPSTFIAFDSPFLSAFKQ